MKIAIDVTPLESGHKDRGVGKYTERLIAALGKYVPGHTYLTFSKKTRVPKGTDLVHYPFFDIFAPTLPILKRTPTVVTIHDLIPLVFPDHFPAGIRGSLSWQVQKISLKGASAVITDSKRSREDIIRFTGVPSARIHAVYPAAPSLRYDKVAVPSALRTLGVRGGYILYVGDVNWNKNVPALIRAYEGVRTDAHLVLAGKAFSGESPEAKTIANLIRNSPRQADIQTPGFIPDADMHALYANAICLVQPSVYEGFGYPVVEAMASGCPVVSTTGGSLDEVAGPAIRTGVTEASIRKGISEALGVSVSQRRDMQRKGYAWAARFSDREFARNTAKVYETAMR